MACGFLYNPDTQSVLLHLRDGNTPNNPHKWATFGGGEDPGEAPLQTFVREIKEELDLTVKPEDVIPLWDYENVERATHRYVYYMINRAPKSSMKLGEGADFDWIPLEKVFTYDLTEKTARDLRYFMETVANRTTES